MRIMLSCLLACCLWLIPATADKASARPAPAPSASNLPASMRPEYRARTTTKSSAKNHKPVIVIDPGHGGLDPGAISRSGRTFEKVVTLRYALALHDLLNATGLYDVRLTRSRDSFVTLKGRVAKARAWKADLFISLHADSSPDSDTKGLSVYTLSEDRAQRDNDTLIEQANQTEVIRGVHLKGENEEVQGTLLDLARRATTNTSATFAEMLVKAMGHDAQLLDHTHRQKSLAVLTSIDVPSVLIELGYLSNRQEEKLLRTDDYRDALVSGMQTAIEKYFKRFPVGG